MTALRAKYIRDLTVRGRAQRTQRAYTRYVYPLARLTRGQSQSRLLSREMSLCLLAKNTLIATLVDILRTSVTFFTKPEGYVHRMIRYLRSGLILVILLIPN